MADPAGVCGVKKTRQKRRWTSWKRNGSAGTGGAPVVATQMGESVSVLPLSGEYPQSHFTPRMQSNRRTVSSEADENQRFPE